MPKYRFQDFFIPAYMMDDLNRYVHEHIAPGDFLQAVICNDLCEAVTRADHINMQNLPAYAAYFYNEAPRACWGSVENMDAWLDARKVEA